MKRKLYNLLLCCFLVLVCACDANNSEVNNMSKKDRNSVSFIGMINNAPRSTENQILENVDKIIIESGAHLGVAMNIEEKWMSNSKVKLAEYSDPEYYLNDQEIEEFLDILRKYDVQSWNAHYIEQPDGSTDPYIFNLFLLYKDGTVEEHRVEIWNDGERPPRLSDFVHEVKDWVYKRIPRAKPGEN